MGYKDYYEYYNPKNYRVAFEEPKIKHYIIRTAGRSTGCTEVAGYFSQMAYSPADAWERFKRNHPDYKALDIFEKVAVIESTPTLKVP